MSSSELLVLSITDQSMVDTVNYAQREKHGMNGILFFVSITWDKNSTHTPLGRALAEGCQRQLCKSGPSAPHALLLLLLLLLHF